MVIFPVRLNLDLLLQAKEWVEDSGELYTSVGHLIRVSLIKMLRGDFNGEGETKKSERKGIN